MSGSPRAPELFSLSLSSPLPAVKPCPKKLKDHYGAVSGQLLVQAGEERQAEGNWCSRGCTGRGEPGNANEGEVLGSTQGC